MLRVAFAVVVSLGSTLASADDLDTLLEWMTGSFSSQAQAEANESYFDIRLEMVEIWRERDDGPWLYVEQAAATSLEQPYRQRIYRLSARGDGSYHSEVFALPEPLQFAGAWRDVDRLGVIGPDDLEIRTGCTVVLRRESPQRFVGATVGEACTSTLRGASYATSEVVVTAQGIESWDRGFSSADEQVWGAETGPYVFRRLP